MHESKFYRFFRPIVPPFLRPLFLKYQEILSYLFFGAMTTLVNLIIYYPLSHIIHYLIANAVAWAGAVVFAFVVNKLFVFESHAKNPSGLLYEMGTFFAARLLSLGLEEGILLLFVGQLHMNNDIVKLAAQIAVIVFNYIASKLVIFRKKA